MARMRKETGKKRGKSKNLELKNVLVVCEGQTGYSEPAYLKGLKKHLKIEDSQMTVIGSEVCGSAPSSIIRDAKERLRQAKKDKSSYSRVFCVFDTEFDPQHASTPDAINMLESNNDITGIISNPRFEYWLLLHFEAKVFTLQNRGELDKYMNKHAELKEYRKQKRISNMSIFTHKIDIAVGNCKNLGFSAKSVREIQKSNQSVTNFHILIEQIYEIFLRKN